MKRPSLWIFLLCAGTVALPYLANSPSNIDKVLENQQERVSNDPRDPAGWNDLGNLLVLEDRLSEAEQAYRRALDLAPADTSTRFNLALLLQQNGNSEGAESELRQILGLNPHHAWAHYQVGVLMAARKNRSMAIDHFARALAYDPKLSFSENNPHILDNPLFSEALLRSQKYLSSIATRVPRTYSEPDRIVNLMLEDENQMLEDEAMAREEAENGEGDGSGKGAATNGSRASFDDEEEDNASASLPTGSPRRESPPNNSRVLQGTTVGSPTGQESSGELNRRQVAEQDRNERQARELRQSPPVQDRSSLRRTPPVPNPDQTSVEQAPPTSNRRPSASGRRTGGSRYIPGSNSTSRLELKLLPEETPTRYASLDPNPGR